MRKVIGGKVYDTEKANMILEWSNDYSKNDFRRREKTLYLTNKGAWFMHHRGGGLTDMATRVGDVYTAGEDIEVLDDKDAKGFLEKNQAFEELEEYFPGYLEEA